MKHLKIFVPILVIFILAVGSYVYITTDDNYKFTVATSADFPPFENYENGEYVGFEIDLCKEIAAVMGKKLVIKNVEFENVLADVCSDKADIAASALTINDKRKLSVDFTTPFYTVGQVLIVRADDNIFTGTTVPQLEKQLRNKTVGACIGYTGCTYIKGSRFWGYPGIKGAKLKPYKNVDNGITDLKNGLIDTFILENAVARRLVSSASNKGKIKIIDIPLTVEHYAIAVKKGNTELISKLNAALREIQKSGKLNELLTKWELN